MTDRPTDLEISYSDGLEDWLAREQVSLAFATPPSKLFLVGLDDSGGLSVFERTFNKCMGLAVDGTEAIYLGTRYQVWRLQHAPAQHEDYAGYDRCYVPRRVWTTGYVNCHDVASDGAGGVVFVNTRYGCLARLSDDQSFEPVWWPPYQRRRQQGDCCHLNGLAMREGAPAYVTSVSTTDGLDSWRNHRTGGGVVVDVASGEVVCGDLSMPHSPRLYRGQLWLTNSGTGQLGRVDLDRGRFEPTTFAPGFLRGLSFTGDYALVGSSRFRGSGAYSRLPLDAALEEAGTGPKLGVFVVDLRTGEIAEWLVIESGYLHELFDVVALPGVRRPMALGLVNDEIEHQIWFDSASLDRGIA